MNRSWRLFTIILVACFGVAGLAGTITYVGIPSIQSDGNCGISRGHGYTTAVDGGNTRGTDRMLNGITLFSLRGTQHNTAAADNCTINALSGTLTDAGLTSKNIGADGTVRDFLSDMVFNNAGGDNSEVEIVLDPESLEHGSTYDLRVYICSGSGQNRQVNLAFFGEGPNGVETGFFNEDDARTSAGRFSTANQVYYINYRYTWDGDSTPGIIVSQKFGGAPFCLYALTNELVKSDGADAGKAAGTIGTEHGKEESTSDRKTRRKGQGQLAPGNAAAVGPGSANATHAEAAGLDQHPKKHRAELQGGDAGTDQRQQLDGGNNQQTGYAQAGTGSGRHHPGQSLNKEKEKAAVGADSATPEAGIGIENGMTSGETAEHGGRRRRKRVTKRRPQIQAAGATATPGRGEIRNQRQQQQQSRRQSTPAPRWRLSLP